MEKGSASASGSSSSSSSGSGSATSTSTTITTTTNIMEKGSASASGSDSSSATSIVLEKSSTCASGLISSSATSMAVGKGSSSGSSSSSSSASASATSTTTTKIMEKGSRSGSGSGSATSTTKINNAIRALVVDDDTLVRKLHGRILEKEFKIEDCIQGKDGKQAVDIHTDGQKFDLILMDSQMPKMDGIEATKNLREMGIASIIIGVSSEENAEQRFKEAGANSYVQKPLTADKLKPILEEFKLI